MPAHFPDGRAGKDLKVELEHQRMAKLAQCNPYSKLGKVVVGKAGLRHSNGPARCLPAEAGAGQTLHADRSGVH